MKEGWFSKVSLLFRIIQILSFYERHRTRMWGGLSADPLPSLWQHYTATFGASFNLGRTNDLKISSQFSLGDVWIPTIECDFVLTCIPVCWFLSLSKPVQSPWRLLNFFKSLVSLSFVIRAYFETQLLKSTVLYIFKSSAQCDLQRVDCMTPVSRLIFCGIMNSSLCWWLWPRW